MKLILIRGLPGSGKSTMARQLYKESRGKLIHREADMYFIKNGVYCFDNQKLSLAHDWCQDEVEYWTSHGHSAVVSNTFTRKWEMKSYYDIAAKYGADVQVLVATGNFKNEHNVPEEVIERMRARWEK